MGNTLSSSSSSSSGLSDREPPQKKQKRGMPKEDDDNGNDTNSRDKTTTTTTTTFVSRLLASISTTITGNGGNNNAAVDAAAVVLKDDILYHITSFIDPVDELQLALCCKTFYFALSKRAMAQFKKHVVLATDDEQSEIHRIGTLSQAMNILRDALAPYMNLEEEDDDEDQEESVPMPDHCSPTLFLLQAIFAADDMGESLLAGWNDTNLWLPFRFLLCCSYTTPLAGSSMGPAIAASTAAAGPNSLAWVTARGVVMILDLSTLELTLMELTREGNPSVSQLMPPRYWFISDKLWYCQNNGRFVLKHGAIHEREINSVRLMDPTVTDQDIGRGAGVTGIAQQFLHASPTFQACTRKDVTVSSQHGLVFFVAQKGNGTLYIESYETTQGQPVASTTHAAITITEGNEPRYGYVTQSTVSHDKLIVAVNAEGGGPFPDAGFGIYVFDCHDLTFISYSPMFEMAVHIDTTTPDWLVYNQMGGRTRPSCRAVKITGGTIEPMVGGIDLGERSNVLLVTSTSVYGYNPDEREGQIEIDEFNIRSGKKMRTLHTHIDWEVPNEDNEDRPYHRMMANAMVVGKRLVFLITSVGSHINTMVTFALPTTD